MLKKLALLLCLTFLSVTSSLAKNDAPQFDPPHWWAGMHDPSLQIQVHAPGIRAS